MPPFDDKTGKVINGYRVLRFERMSEDKRPRPEWLFQCQTCGATFVAQFSSVSNGLRTCKQCRRESRIENLAGKIFGRLLVTERTCVNKHHQAVWRARCTVCADIFTRSAAHLKMCKACPCGKGRETHGLSKSPTYKTWNAMMNRCTNPNTYRFDRYGGRGISVCDRWKIFANFYSDMGTRPRNASLDRIDNNGNYEPGNCRWATRVEQRRNMHENTLITYNGETLPLATWAQRLGMTRATLRWRYVRQGWSAERSLTDPIIRGDPAKRKPFKP